MLQNLLDNYRKHTLEIWLVAIVLLISGLVHGYNMFGFPYYENDEGVYLSQAWTFATSGKLAPYTYWYDHAPVGWIFTSLWLTLTRSMFAWSFSLNSGRVFMLVVHLISTYFVIRIVKKLTGNLAAGLISALIFSLTPLGLYFQRRLLLDNLMIFWVLGSFNLLLGKSKKLTHYVWSAILFGLAVLTKENAVFFIPGFLLTIFTTSHPHHRNFALVKWITIVGFVVSTYFLYAILKGEFFAPGTLLGGTGQHVSLLQSLKYQSSRGGGSILDYKNSSFWHNFQLWIVQDRFIVFSGIFANLVLFILSFFKSKRNYLGLSILGILFWLFLIRGGIVIEFYILPLIPYLGIFIGITLFEFFSLSKKIIPALNPNFPLTIICLFIMGFYYQYNQVSRSFGQNNTGHLFFQSHQTLAQIQAVDWVRKNVDPSSIMIIDNYSYLEFHDPRNPSHLVYPNAHWYWKVDQDPEIQQGLLKGSPQLVDYILKTPQMEGDLAMGISPITTEALNHSHIITSFNTDGWGVEIWATSYPDKLLKRSWNSYKKTFLQNNNQTVDPSNGHLTTSEGQSYALLRSVWMGDKATFANVWSWTQKNLQRPDGVFAWKYGVGPNNKSQILDPGTASDADSDIALSLLMASRLWHDDTYLAAAKNVINGIWKTDVREFRGRYYLIPGNWAQGKDDLIVNPSYFSPYAYRIFSEVDPAHDWLSLVDTSYETLNGCMVSKLGQKDASVFLPPNWCEVDRNGVYIQPVDPGLKSTDYSYDAVRVMWRLALDYRWFSEPKAKALLQQSSLFLKSQWETQGKILVGYTHSGVPWEKYESALGYSASLANFTITDPDLAKSLYNSQVSSKFYEDFSKGQSYWEDETNYYLQNWVWFGTAIYADQLPNLWSTSP